jgi:ABC-type sugar transport system ATPase subunit
MGDIAFEQVSKVHPDGTKAVRAVDLEIDDGALMVLVGPSGCGKTTLLRMVAGLEEVTAGTIRIGDRPVNDVPAKNRDIAMVFQNYALYPHMTVFENQAFGLRRLAKQEIDTRVRGVAGVLASTTSSRRSRASSPAASASASRWAGRSSASPRPSSWTSRCRTSTRSCACRCAPRSRACSATSARR